MVNRVRDEGGRKPEGVFARNCVQRDMGTSGATDSFVVHVAFQMDTGVNKEDHDV